jgi:LytS/YehU family sensor histidine kinase
MGLWLYEQWRWLKMLKADKAKAELTLLKNQINPHFFFNTLNNLYGLAVEKSEQAPAMILKLSDIMRYTIYEGKADYVPLKEEVAYLEDYIELHKIRYHKKVDISFHKSLQHSHKIAPLLLIVPLENAFKHGVESLAEHAFIKLEIRTTPKSLFFQISNNYEPTVQEGKGIGLTNLKKRLALIYPNRHHLDITKTAKIYTLSLEIESYELSDHRR